MNNEKKRNSIGSTPINADKENQSDLGLTIDGNSPIANPTAGTKRRLSFDEDSSDEEIIFTKQALSLIHI